MRKIILSSSVLLVLASCRPEVKQNKHDYFSLTNYFADEAKHYQQADFYVVKTVSRNQETETKRVKIDNWPGELSVFSESDINKPAWKNSYSKTVSGNITIYKTTEPDLKTREIIIKRNGKGISYLMIYNVVNNKLFQMKEKLSFFPDSLYVIQRKQHVRFLGENDYLITGKIK